MKYSDVVGVGHADFVQRNVEVVSFAFTLSDVVEIRFYQIWPKFTVLVTVDREVYNAVKKHGSVNDWILLSDRSTTEDRRRTFAG